MKTIKNIKIYASILLLFIVFVGCEREITNENDLATFPTTAEIFTDSPIGLGSDFYFPYGGSKATAWSVDETTGYESNVSMRFDVPNSNDPQGNFAGAIFRVDGIGRDLRGYDALTFWAKASQGVVIGEFGFGEDFVENKYITTINNTSLGTAWQKIIIPIPDASKLTQERGMFRLSAGTQGTNGLGYTIWVDELKFEKLGNIRTIDGAIMNGNTTTFNTFVGVTSNISGIISTFNLGNGQNQIVNLSTAYFEFESSDSSVATVNSNGVVTSLKAGVTEITAKINGVNAKGKLIINCAGVFTHAPTPTKSSSDVISIFSDAYSNAPVNYYNGYWAPWQTTVSNDFSVNGDNILNYTIFNFVGIEFSAPTINATAMTHFHMDAFIPGTIASGRELRVIVVDFGPDGAFGGGDDTRHSTRFVAPFVKSQQWMSIDISFSAMTSLTRRANLAQVILEGGDSSIMYVDNIYFYK